MRTASDPGYEGMGNLVAALRVASNPEARGYGVLVVMNDEIHAARDVTKIHTTALNAFASPPWGPIGHVDRDRVILARRPPREHIPAPFLEPDVHLITLTIGCDDRFLRWLLDSPSGPPRGVVIEALGGGRVPPWWLSAIGTAVQHGVAVVITSRTGAGRTIDGYAYAGAHRDLADLGCLFANGLSGPKARLKLMAALATAATPSDLASYFPF
jgi:L-asparaginase